MQTKKIKKMTYCGLFTAIISVCSWISIPTAVPFTLQTLGIFLAFFTLGNRCGLASYVAYLLLGIMGVPVFSGFKCGIGVIFSHTGGYLLGFLIGGVVLALLDVFTPAIKNKKIISGGIILLAGYFTAVVWYALFAHGVRNISGIIHICIIPFVPFDIIKLAISVNVSKKVRFR